jgi:hypothetical protein
MRPAYRRSDLIEQTSILPDRFLDPAIEIIVEVTLNVPDQDLPEHAGVKRL